MKGRDACPRRIRWSDPNAAAVDLARIFMGERWSWSADRPQNVESLDCL